MHKKSLSRSLQSSASIGLSVLALGALLTGCGSSTTEDQACFSQDGNWKFPTCNPAGPYEYVGVPGVPCTTPDNQVYRTDCANPATGTPTGAPPVQPGITPTPVTPGITPVTPGITPVTPGTTPVTPGTTPVTPGTTPVTPGTPPVTPGTTPVTPGTTPVTPGTPPVTPGTDPVTPTTPPPAGTDPAGYWRQGDLHGCVWTGVDDKNVGTEIAPQDFTGGLVDGAYCVKGAVGPEVEYQGVALLGFNLAQDPVGADCTYNPDTATSEGPPGVELSSTGLAVNFARNAATFEVRVQIQGPNGASDPDDRWCFTPELQQGKDFIEWSDFNTECWEGGDGKAYNGEPISAVVFMVAGDDENETPFDFCVNGFAPGSSATDAPDGAAMGNQSGTIGVGEDYDRAKVTVDGQQYIIQNNNWGNEAGELVMDFQDNSFTLKSGSGSSKGDHVPLSFPSIYIGANGFTGNGMTTSATDKLPIQISNIQSIPSTFQWDGSTGVFNATYDIWFANSPPSGQYNDGIDGFAMIWTYFPASEQPIGFENGKKGTYTDSSGVSWDIYVGPRGNGPEGYNDAPVVNFVNPSRGATDRKNFSADVGGFIKEATKHGLSNSMYLTDIFAGFEIWDGGAGGGLSVKEFTCKVNP